MEKIFLILLFISNSITGHSQGIGNQAPLFSGKTISGDTVNLSDYKGKVTILDFWASWCKPCKEEFPFLIELYNQNSEKKFSILTINEDEESANMKKFIDNLEKEIPFKIILDKNAKIIELYGIESMPSVFVIDKKGIVRFTHIGFKKDDKEKFKSEIAKLINE